VENVVRNAVRYTTAGSEVEITLANRDSTAEITVRDHGPGVPDAELQNLFRPFYRVANARERGTGGVGLGLAIADRAVRLHGGTVAAANAPGGGLVVKIRVPAQCG
jgi:two-component system sensor histidine kinase CpxA